MTPITDAEVKQAFATASERAREYIESDELYNAFHEIRKTYNLHLDQAGALALAIDAIILDLRPFEQFPAMLKDILRNATGEVQQGVLRDINTKVFAMFREATRERVTLTAPAAQPKASAPNTTRLDPIPAAPITLKPISILESKLAATSAPTPVHQTVAAPAIPTAPAAQSNPTAPQPAVAATPLPAPAAAPAPAPSPVKYHGTDPYREPFQ